VLRCGPVALHGAGSHDHNDQLSYELALDGTPVISDSGTYCYTRDLGARFAFRTTAAHNAIQVGTEEQNPIRVDRPWRILADRTQSRCTRWVSDAVEDGVTGRHEGFAHRPSRAVCLRAIRVEKATGVWEIRDRVEGGGREALTWRTHFMPGQIALHPGECGSWVVTHDRVPGYYFHVSAGVPLALEVGTSRYSGRYGESQPRPVLVAHLEVELPFELSLVVRPCGSQAAPALKTN
jgi:hypothetical protein